MYGYEHNDSTQKGLKNKTIWYGYEKEDHIVTLPKNTFKTRPYNIDMEKMDSKTRPYNIDMEKKLSKGQLIKLLLKQKKSKKVRNHEDLLDNNPFKDEVAQEPAKRIKPPKPTRKPLPPPIPQVEEKVPLSKIKKLNRALKGHAKSYDIELQDNPLNHLINT